MKIVVCPTDRDPLTETEMQKLLGKYNVMTGATICGPKVITFLLYHPDCKPGKHYSLTVRRPDGSLPTDCDPYIPRRDVIAALKGIAP